MSRIRFFQTLVIVSAFLYLAWFFIPYLPRSHSREVWRALNMSGHGASSVIQHPAFYLAIGAAKLVATLGLLLFLSWSRWLLVVVLVISIFSIPFAGLTVAPALDSFVGALTGLADGAILALAFSSPIAERWRKDV